MLRFTVRLATPSSTTRAFCASPITSAAPKDGSNLTESILAQNAKTSINLNTLKDNEGANRKIKRVGRGPGSKRGKTSTKGMKGSWARSTVNRGFEGGQTPMWKNVRKFGFTNAKFARRYAVVNLDKLQLFIDTGRVGSRLTPEGAHVISMRDLLKSGCVGRLRRAQVGIKLLSDGVDSFKSKVDIEVTQASSTALAAVEAAGGKVRLVHYDRVSLRKVEHQAELQEGLRSAPPPQWLNRRLRHPLQSLKEAHSDGVHLSVRAKAEDA